MHYTKNLGRIQIWGLYTLSAHPQKCGVGLRRWENQCRPSSYGFYSVVASNFFSFQFLFSLQINDVAYIVFVFVDDNNNGVSEMRNCGRIAVTHSLKSITAGQHCVVNAVDGMLTRTDRGRYDKLFGCATLVWQKK